MWPVLLFQVLTLCCVYADDVERNTTAIYEPPAYENINNLSASVDPNECPPVDPSLTSPKTGQKAWDKCLEYQERLVYPCERDEGLTGGGLKRGNKCLSSDDLIVKAVDDNINRHTAQLGFDQLPKVQWLCGGAVISERFVLTASHCLSSRESGAVTYVMVGAPRSTDAEDTRRYRVKQTHRHPGYKPPRRYNDIGLVETEKDMLLGEFLVPACLHTDDDVDKATTIAPQWHPSKPEYITKRPMKQLPSQQCYEENSGSPRTGQVNATLQACYIPTDGKDNCEELGGNPLLFPSRRLSCMHLVVGITSYGRKCEAGVSTVFTRVAPYVDWIESIVWP